MNFYLTVFYRYFYVSVRVIRKIYILIKKGYLILFT